MKQKNIVPQVSVWYTISRGEARVIDDLSQWKMHVPGVSGLLESINIHRRHKISIRDALIICNAKEPGCPVLWTEDMNHGQCLEGVKINTKPVRHRQ